VRLLLVLLLPMPPELPVLLSPVSASHSGGVCSRGARVWRQARKLASRVSFTPAKGKPQCSKAYTSNRYLKNGSCVCVCVSREKMGMASEARNGIVRSAQARLVREARQERIS